MRQLEASAHISTKSTKSETHGCCSRFFARTVTALSAEMKSSRATNLTKDNMFLWRTRKSRNLLPLLRGTWRLWRSQNSRKSIRFSLTHPTFCIAEDSGKKAYQLLTKALE